MKTHHSKIKSLSVKKTNKQTSAKFSFCEMNDERIQPIPCSSLHCFPMFFVVILSKI